MRDRDGGWIRIATVAAALAAPTALLVAGCGDDAEPSGTTVELANPASVYCEDQGGTVEIVDEADGQVGYCNLPDGSRVEEWELYRSSTTEP